MNVEKIIFEISRGQTLRYTLVAGFLSAAVSSSNQSSLPMVSLLDQHWKNTTERYFMRGSRADGRAQRCGGRAPHYSSTGSAFIYA